MKLFGKELKFNNNKVYHAGDKPTPTEIGAANASHTHSNYVVNTNQTSLELVQSKNSFVVGTGKTSEGDKDYTSQMVKSLITLDNITGKTVRENNTLKSTEIYSIINTGKSVPLSLNWSTPEVVHNNATFTYTSNSVKISATDKTWAALQYNFKVEPNTEYAFICDWVSTSETARVLIKNGESTMLYHENELPRNEKAGNKLSTVFKTGTSPNLQLTLYSSIRYASGYTEYKNIKLIPRPKSVITPKITLNSLPNGVCDSIKDGKIFSNTITFKLDGSEPDWVHWINKNGFSVFYFRPWGIKPTADGVNTGILCDRLPSISYNESANPTKEGVSLYSGYSYIGVCVKSTTASSVDAFKTYLKSNPMTVIAECYDEIKSVYSVPLSVLCDKGDTIYIDSPTPITTTHQVSLNPVSQIEETQNVVSNSTKYIFDIKAWISNFSISSYTTGDNGYVKLPSALGGFIIQWGTAYDVASNTITRVNYPIAFTSTVKYVGGVIQGEWYLEGGATKSSNGAVCNRRDLTYFNAGHCFGQPRSINWIAFGK